MRDAALHERLRGAKVKIQLTVAWDPGRHSARMAMGWGFDRVDQVWAKMTRGAPKPDHWTFIVTIEHDGFSVHAHGTDGTYADVLNRAQTLMLNLMDDYADLHKAEAGKMVVSMGA